MSLEKIITAITGCPYDELYKTLPADTDRQKVVSTYEAIINECLTGHPMQQSPYLINVSGIPGSGKTTYCRELAKMPEHSDAIYIGFDAIMEHAELPYSTEVQINPEEAFRRWELSARIAGYELLKRATEKKYDIIFDHSSAHYHHVSLFENLLRKGYNIYFYYLSINPQTAKQRTHHRKRYVPPTYIDDRYTALQKLLPEYRKICTTFKQIEQ